MRGRRGEALALLALAADRYRVELAIEPLARLRVHELLLQERSGSAPTADARLMLEIVSRLNRLDRLESLDPPFALEDARTVLSAWIECDGQGTRAAPAAAA